MGKDAALIFRLVHSTARERALQAVREAPEGWVVQMKPPTRSLESNAAMWAMLTDISEQVVWHGRHLTPAEWKHVMTAGLKKQTVVPNIDGDGFVVLGLSTSSMSKQEMSDLLEVIQAFGAQQGVTFKD